MVGFTYNEISRRYVSDEPDFYYPEVWRGKPEGSIKQGSAGVVTKLVYDHGYREDGVPVGPEYAEFIDNTIDFYNTMLKSGVAPEMARMVLPQSMMTSYYVTGSLAAFARMVKQRKDPHAQLEIQDLAKKIEAVIEPLYPVSWAALTK
jgi:thymidylate synthase (FAD)